MFRLKRQRRQEQEELRQEQEELIDISSDQAKQRSQQADSAQGTAFKVSILRRRSQRSH